MCVLFYLLILAVFRCESVENMTRRNPYKVRTFTTMDQNKPRYMISLDSFWLQTYYSSMYCNWQLVVVAGLSSHVGISDSIKEVEQSVVTSPSCISHLELTSMCLTHAFMVRWPDPFSVYGVAYYPILIQYA